MYNFHDIMHGTHHRIVSFSVSVKRLNFPSTALYFKSDIVLNDRPANGRELKLVQTLKISNSPSPKISLHKNVVE